MFRNFGLAWLVPITSDASRLRKFQASEVEPEFSNLIAAVPLSEALSSGSIILQDVNKHYQ